MKSELNNILDLSNVNWNDIEKFALPNLVKEVCDYWNNKEKWETTAHLSIVFGLRRNTITDYLKKGSRHNWCNYDPKEEMRKSASKKNRNGKQIEIFKNGKSLGTFKTGKELERQSEERFGVKLLQSGISSACTGYKSPYKGFTFKYI